MGIDITIECEFLRPDTKRLLHLDAREYYELETDEPADIENSSPLHAHAVEYLGISTANVERTQITITDTDSNKTSIIDEKFWNSGRNRIIERRDNFGDSSDYWELIMDIATHDSPGVFEVLRLGRKDGFIEVLSHVFVERLADGTETERCIS